MVEGTVGMETGMPALGFLKIRTYLEPGRGNYRASNASYFDMIFFSLFPCRIL